MDPEVPVLSVTDLGIIRNIEMNAEGNPIITITPTYSGCPAMDVISYSETRANLKEVMDRVVEDRTPVLVTRQKAESVVMVSLSDWHAMEETLHLLSSPVNADRLRKSIAELDGGQGAERTLIQP